MTAYDRSQPMAATLSRRTVLKSAAALAATSTVGTALPRVAGAAAAASASPNERLLVVFLRGAADHLSITVPLDEANYHDLRPTIAIAPEATLPLDDRFGLHPALPRLHARYQAGEMAPVVAVGNPAADRSHFLSQDLFERGSDGTDDLGDGWLARHLNATTQPNDGALRAVTVGANVDESLIGFPALGMTSLQTFGLSRAGDFAGPLEDMMRELHRSDSYLDQAAIQALDAAAVVAGLPVSQHRNRTAAAFEDIVTLFEADLGIEVVTVSTEGWDTHDRMGTAEEGDMRNLLSNLDDTVGEMLDGFDQAGVDDVTTLVVTEFGRRVAENGSNGCDHGWGSAALVIGSNVNGGRVHGDWPGLDPDVLGDTNGDVPMTTDYRDLLGEVATATLGANPNVVFPDHLLEPVGVKA
ncbi:MAG: DUF1501 domain-containing protein [Acidimicrobiales bacterium]